jgi:hypothetical protein
MTIYFAWTSMQKRRSRELRRQTCVHKQPGGRTGRNGRTEREGTNGGSCCL